MVGTTLSLTGPPSLILGAVGSFSVSLTDSGGNAIVGQAVVATSANGNTITPANVTTDNTGHASFNVTAVKSGNDTIQVTALGLAATQALTSQQPEFQFHLPGPGRPRWTLGHLEFVTSCGPMPARRSLVKP